MAENKPQKLIKQHPAITTPVLIQKFSKLVSGFYFDQYLVSGFTVGFRLGYVGPRSARTSENLPSCAESPHVINKKLNKEVALNRVRGPFISPPFNNLQISPIGCVPKKLEGEFRLIHHLSYPLGSSINDFICDELATVSYANFDDAANLVVKLGHNCLLAKTDIESAFRLVPIHPDDYELLGIKWDNQFYYDTCLPFGASSSCAIFERFSTSLEWIAKNKLGISHIIHILDDFLILGKASTNECSKGLYTFLSLCHLIGVPINNDKTVEPTTCIVFMGVELDSASMEARLPLEKILKAKDLLNQFRNCRKVTLRELQSLLGFLNFCCTVVRPGRCFLRRLTNLTINKHYPKHKITLNRESRRDLRAWEIFIEHFNGKNLLLNNIFLSTTSMHLHTDAAGSLGFGAIFGSHWFYGEWPVQCQSLNITFKELFPIVLAFDTWGHQLRNKCITVHSDNQAVVYILNKQSSKDFQIMNLVRHFVLYCMTYNILVKAQHIPGKANILPDLLSRLQIEEFHKLAPNMDIDPTPFDLEMLDNL